MVIPQDSRKRQRRLPCIQAYACKGEVYCISLSISVVSDSFQSHKEPAIEHLLLLVTKQQQWYNYLTQYAEVETGDTSKVLFMGKLVL